MRARFLFHAAFVAFSLGLHSRAMAFSVVVDPPPPPTISISFPALNGDVLAIQTLQNEDGSGVIYLAGTFTQVGGETRNHLAALDLATGSLKTWDPNVDGPVSTLSLINGVIYFGGAFSHVGGSARSNLAAVDGTTGTLSSWAPDPDGAVDVLCPLGGNLFVGGAFATLGGQARSRLGGFSLTSGAVLSWNPGADGEVRVLSGSGSTLYAGGDFANAGSGARPFAAAFDAVSGDLRPWNPTPNGAVRAIQVASSGVFLGGDFSTVGGISHPFVASVDPDSGAASAWDPRVNGSVRTFQLLYHILYLGGDFTTAGGAAHSRIVAVHSVTGEVLTGSPVFDSTVNVLQYVGPAPSSSAYRDPTYSALLVGGSFSSFGAVSVRGFTGFRDPAWTISPHVAITLFNGMPRKHYLSKTKKRFFTLSGISWTSGAPIEYVAVLSAAGYSAGGVFFDHPSSWSITLSVHKLHSFVADCVDSFGRHTADTNAGTSIEVERIPKHKHKK